MIGKSFAAMLAIAMTLWVTVNCQEVSLRAFEVGAKFVHLFSQYCSQFPGEGLHSMGYGNPSRQCLV